VPVPATSIDRDAVDAAHRAVRADPSIQFDFPWREAEVRETPEWLRSLSAAIDHFFRALGPFWQVVFWVMVAAVALLLLFTLVPPLRAWLAARLHRAPVDAAAEWRPEPAASRTLLAEAEALAADGRFEAAVQLLLRRSIDDIEAWRSGLFGRSATARDIAGVAAIPGPARAMFARLVTLTERGIFAQRKLGEADWHAARDAYRAFAL
jgi:hypothetical protein